MVEYLVTYTIDNEFEYKCTAIATSITHALGLVDVYIEKKWPGAKEHEICGCEFVKRIDTLLIERP